MIQSFRDKETEKVWFGYRSQRLPHHIQATARKKLRMLHNAQNLKDLYTPPNNRLEALKGRRKKFYSIRINDQWRICFGWDSGHSFAVEIVDYH